MKYTKQIIRMFSFLAITGIAATVYGNPPPKPLDPSGELPTIPELKHPIVTPKPGDNYTMRHIPPSQKYECKIRYASPDPSIRYTIRNVRPDLDKPPMWKNDHFRRIFPKGYPRE